MEDPFGRKIIWELTINQKNDIQTLPKFRVGCILEHSIDQKNISGAFTETGPFETFISIDCLSVPVLHLYEKAV